MRILGLDPGLERIGFGFIERKGSQLKVIDFGLIQTPKILIPDRLKIIHEEVTNLILRTEPDAIATEQLMFSVNKKTAMDVSKAVGVILLCVGQSVCKWSEYTPPEIKQAVVGTGTADKKQVTFMVTKLLSLPEPPKPDDVADALAIAICHAFKSRLSY